MPRPADCLKVERVAQGSVAAKAGVLPGDLIQEGQLLEVDFWQALSRAAAPRPRLS